MVRDLETEIVATHQILLDIGGAMRGGSPGRSRLDTGIELAAGLARAALDGGDRVGLVTFDTRIYAELKPDEGRHHLYELVDRLLETHNVVDEDLTDLTAGELVSAVAAYLAHQEAIDVRLRRAPPLDDPAWERIQAGPGGELYDLQALARVTTTLLSAMGGADRKALAPAWWWQRVHVASDSDPLHAKLRLFCRLRGLDLPYRREAERGRRGAGLAAAVRRATAARVDSLLVISDLGGLLDAPADALAALGRARRGGAQVVAIVPTATGLIAPPDTESGDRVLRALVDDEAGQRAEARRLLAGHGAALLEVGPADSAATIAARLSRRGPARRVA
jgi:hypothetical protein